MHWPDKPLDYEKVFRDPIHQYIHIQDQVILDIINTKEFQRLRRIKQLGTTSFVFHGAEHSRFGHSLGVYDITRRICDLFQRNYPISRCKEDGWDNNERIVALAAALLHDIGHGAYSHTFEHVFHTHHETITTDIILSEDTEVHQVLAKFHPDFPKAVAAVINKTYDSPQVVQLISSQADADRMDYLLRDAYYTGADYGVFDLSRVLRVMRPYHAGICFHDTGMHAVEDYITSRYQMFSQVYFHPVSRGMEVILMHAIDRAQYLYPNHQAYFERTSPGLCPFFDNTWQLSDYLALDDGVLMTYIQQWTTSEDTILADLSQRFICRQPFKSIQLPTGTDLRQLKRLTHLLKKMGYDPTYYATVNTANDLPYDIYRARKHHPRTQIELRAEDGTLYELSSKSSMVNALSGEWQRDDRFYFPRELLKPSEEEKARMQPYLSQFHQYIHNQTFIVKGD